jgi:hypothetical protein
MDEAWVGSLCVIPHPSDFYGSGVTPDLDRQIKDAPRHRIGRLRSGKDRKVLK